MSRPQNDGPRMPAGFEPTRLVRRAVPVVIALAVLVLIVVLAPGLGEVRGRLKEADPAWLALAVALEVASSLSYVLMFKPIFCRTMSWRFASKIGLSEIGVSSIVPASGAGGLALGAWILSREGMPADKIARRSVAFFLIKGSVNFVAVAVVGTAMALGLVGPPKSLLLTALPAALATLLIALVVLIPRLGPGEDPPAGAGRIHRAWSATRRSLIGGTAEAVEIFRSRDPLILAGAVGYWAFDNVMLWATFEAFGDSPDISIILMGYLIGQLGGLLPLPGGVGGIDGGLIGALVVYGVPAASAAAAVLAFRLILFWIPLFLGVPAFISLMRELKEHERPAGRSG